MKVAGSPALMILWMATLSLLIADRTSAVEEEEIVRENLAAPAAAARTTSDSEQLVRPPRMIKVLNLSPLNGRLYLQSLRNPKPVDQNLLQLENRFEEALQRRGTMRAKSASHATPGEVSQITDAGAQASRPKDPKSAIEEGGGGAQAAAAAAVTASHAEQPARAPERAPASRPKDPMSAIEEEGGGPQTAAAAAVTASHAEQPARAPERPPGNFNHREPVYIAYRKERPYSNPYLVHIEAPVAAQREPVYLAYREGHQSTERDTHT